MEKLIDIEQIINSKSKVLTKVLPKFIINWLKSLVHQDELNTIIQSAADKRGKDFAKHCINSLGVTYKCNGLENISKEGRYIFASNHPLGGLDGLILMDIIGTQFGDFKSISNDIVLNLEPLIDNMIGVNKFGGQKRDSLIEITKFADTKAQLITFPAGLCSRLIKGKITDLQWQKSFIKIAQKSNREIVPIFFEGQNSKFFYKLANWRKKLNIKFNIEMILLPKEMFKKRNQKFNITFGKPINLNHIPDLNSHQKVEFIRNKVYSL